MHPIGVVKVAGSEAKLSHIVRCTSCFCSRRRNNQTTGGTQSRSDDVTSGSKDLDYEAVEPKDTAAGNKNRNNRVSAAVQPTYNNLTFETKDERNTYTELELESVDR